MPFLKTARVQSKAGTVQEQIHSLRIKGRRAAVHELSGEDCQRQNGYSAEEKGNSVTQIRLFIFTPYALQLLGVT